MKRNNIENTHKLLNTYTERTFKVKLNDELSTTKKFFPISDGEASDIQITYRRSLVGSVLTYYYRARGQISKQNTESILPAISSQQISGYKSESK